MNWQAICEKKILKDIQYKVETNKWGKIELSPASNEQGIYQAILIEWLVKLGENGRPILGESILIEDFPKKVEIDFA
ncbi:MAG: hypothetical protein NTX45_23355 [Proteobacteria bacterium]|nr:hypothetical protein [Pseudomonadota bacterium]